MPLEWFVDPTSASRAVRTACSWWWKSQQTDTPTRGSPVASAMHVFSDSSSLMSPWSARTLVEVEADGVVGVIVTSAA